MAIDHAVSSDIYAFSSVAIGRSSDGGESWSANTASDQIFEAVAFSPKNPAIAYVVNRGFLDTKNILKTTDGGVTWQFLLNIRGSVQSIDSLIVDPTDSSVAYMEISPPRDGGGGLFKTTDGGLRWKLIANIGKVIAISPSNPKILLAVIGGDLYRSKNGGKKFNATNLADKGIRSAVFSPVDGSLVYAAGAGIYRSKNKGRTWSKIEDDLPDVIVDRILIDPTGSTLYANTQSGTFRSTNDGRNWVRIEGGLNDCSRVLAIDPHNPNVIYAGGCGATSEVFVAKINSTGSAFDYATYLG